ncbi:MAG: hypothetical protein WCK42_08200 [Myxococcaceae bacterium]
MLTSRNELSPSGLIKTVQKYFAKKFPDSDWKRCQTNPSLVDCLMSCLAIFHLKYPSLLSFDKERQEDTLQFKNLKRLYHIEQAPSDTSMREKLDKIEPVQIRGIFKKLFSLAQRGKVLECYEYWNKHYLVSMDGTGQFSSSQVHCENCCLKNHSNGEITYYHHALAAVLVHPQMKRVIPLAPEAITKEDGATKNDCEQNAAKRLLRDLRREHPHLKMIMNEDSLYSTGPHVELLKELDLRFIIGAKPGNLGTLFDWVKHLDMDELEREDARGFQHRYRYTNGVPLNDTYFETKVNFLEYWETDTKGNVQHFSWITDIPLNPKTVELVMRGGRARWRIENETFNTLKNQGYNYEHNYGHGEKNLCSVMGMLMLAVFLIDQLSELCDAAFQKAKAATRTYYNFWAQMRFVFLYFEFDSWDSLFAKITVANSRQSTA